MAKMSLRLPWSLPVFGIVEGAVRTLTNAVVSNCRNFGISLAFTQVHITTQEAMDTFLAETTGKDIKFTANPPSTYDYWENHRWLHPADYEPDNEKRPRALLFGKYIPEVKSLTRLAECWWIGAESFPAGSRGKVHWFPGVTEVSSKGRFWVTQDMPTINAGMAGMAYFDIVSFDTPSLQAGPHTLSTLVEYATERLRPGGILLFRTIPNDFGSCNADVRWLSARYSDLTIAETHQDRDGNKANVLRGYNNPVTIVGVKRPQRVRDEEQVRTLLSALELEDNKVHPNLGYANLVMTPPEFYPSETTISVRRWTEYDDSKIIAKGEPVTALVDSEESISNALSRDYNYVKADPLREFGRTKYAFGGGIEVEGVPIDRLDDLRKLCAGNGWKLTVKGSKALKMSEFASESREVSLRRLPGLTDPQVLTSTINPIFMENFCHELPSLGVAAAEAGIENQLVFPVEPGLANLMKLFGKLHPRVVQGKSGDFSLVGGTVENFFTEVQGVDDKGKPMVTATSRKRAKLVSFKLTGAEKGDRYESVMG